MELHLEPNTIECLAPPSDHERPRAKRLEIFEALRSRVGPELWVGYSGHYHLAICTTDPHALVVECGRKIVQILVDLRIPHNSIPVQYVLPMEHHPWLYASGYAGTIEEAVDLILLAAHSCERRPEYLAERTL